MKTKKTPKLFIETTVFNFYFEGKHGQKQQDAVGLFEEIANGRYEAYTSDVVFNELKKASLDKFIKMNDLSEKYIKKTLETSLEAKRIAELYIKKGIIPANSIKDALHIACAVVNDLDFVISYNQGHIAKTKTMIGTGLVNLREGYRQIGLSTPTEVLEYDR
jgi:predicted nucleic acid-binding protein